jgi:hypothetical protein
MMDKKIKRVCICGGGNAAHVAVGMFSQQGIEVDLYMSYGNEAENMVKCLTLQDRSGSSNNQKGCITVNFDSADNPEHRRLQGRPKMISNNPKDLIPDADLILIITPANAHEAILLSIAPYLKENVIIGASPSPGGFNMLAMYCLQKMDVSEQIVKSLVLFGTACLPWVCRIQKFGESVYLAGTKATVDVNCVPQNATENVLSLLNNLYIGTEFRSVGNFLHTTLFPHNCIIHPGIMFGLFGDWNGKPFKEAPLFYQSMNDSIATILEGLDTDVQYIAHTIEKKMGFQLKVPTLKQLMLDLYPKDIIDKTCIETIFKTNKQYKGLCAPMLNGSNGAETDVDIDPTAGLVPNFHFRYLTEDVPHGLAVLRGIAEILQIDTLFIDEVLTWAQERIGRHYLVEGKMVGADIAYSGCPQRFGIYTIDDLRKSIV